MARPSLSLRIIPRFPAKIQGTDGIHVERTGGAVTLSQNWDDIQKEVVPSDPENYDFLMRKSDGALIRVDALELGALRPIASKPEAAAGTDNTKTMTPARVRDAVELSEFSYDSMANPETLSAIIQRTGTTPIFHGASAADSDHSAAINAAIDKVITAGGGTVWMPHLGTEWKLGSSIQCHKSGTQSSHLKIAGVGERPTFRWLGTTGNAFEIGDGTNPVYNVTLENFYLLSSGRTDGIDFHVVKGNFVKIRNFITDGTWNGIWGEDLNTCSFDDFQIIYPSGAASNGRGITLYSNPSGSGRSDNIDIGRGTVQGHCQGSAGILISGRVHTVKGDRLGMLGVSRGLETTSTGTGLADIPTFIRFNVLEIDRATNISCVLAKGHRIDFTDCDFSNTTGAAGVTADETAVSIAADVSSVKFLGGRAGLCRQHGMVLNGKNIKIIGTDIYGFGQAASNTYHGIYFGGEIDGFSVVSPTVDGNGMGAYAIAVDGGAENGTIRDVIYKGVVSGYSVGTGVNVDNTGEKLATYTL